MLKNDWKSKILKKKSCDNVPSKKFSWGTSDWRSPLFHLSFVSWSTKVRPSCLFEVVFWLQSAPGFDLFITKKTCIQLFFSIVSGSFLWNKMGQSQRFKSAAVLLSSTDFLWQSFAVLVLCLQIDIDSKSELTKVLKLWNILFMMQ